MRNGLLDKHIEALATSTRCCGRASMQIWRKTRLELPRKRPLRFTAQFLAGLLVGQYSALELALQFADRTSLKVQYITHIDNDAMKAIVVFIKFYTGLVIFILHCVHGLIPASVRKIRTALSAPLRTVGSGWGRWKVAIMSFSKNVTREPAPSTLLAPNAESNVSTSFHRILFPGSFEKTRSSVFLCLLFTSPMVPLHDTMCKHWFLESAHRSSETTPRWRHPCEGVDSAQIQLRNCAKSRKLTERRIGLAEERSILRPVCEAGTWHCPFPK